MVGKELRAPLHTRSCAPKGCAHRAEAISRGRHRIHEKGSIKIVQRIRGCQCCADSVHLVLGQQTTSLAGHCGHSAHSVCLFSSNLRTA